ncbi:MAG: S9 family peptidase, partial [Chloroflexi bacterium]|nr:S9 family peptidase [Chloroflexota bacterium]
TERPQADQWLEVIPEGPDTLISVSMVGERWVAHYLRDARSVVRVLDAAGRVEHEMGFPEPATVTAMEGSPNGEEIFFLQAGFTQPGTVYRCNLATGERAALWEPVLPFDPGEYVTEQVSIPSKDGTCIPLFITRRTDTPLDGSRPTYLFGYGGFDISLTPAYSPANMAWMEAGGVYVQAVLRGGGEYGKAWHRAGMKTQKQNVFDDFIAAAEWLVAQGYADRSRLAIGGRSNGGLLMGACLTQRPDLFAACLPFVGVLDSIRYFNFGVSWRGVAEYGSLENPEEFQALLVYSPYHNVHPGVAYPPTLICTGDHDDRVHPSQSYKFAATLQAAQGGPAPILLRTDDRAGHLPGKPASMIIDEWADCWTFVAHALGIA